MTQMSFQRFGSRCDFLAVSGGEVATLAGLHVLCAKNQQSAYLPVRTITQGYKFYWYGYYDKLQFDPTNRLIHSEKVNFEHRTPQPDDAIKVGMVDAVNDDKRIELGNSHA